MDEKNKRRKKQRDKETIGSSKNKDISQTLDDIRSLYLQNIRTLFIETESHEVLNVKKLWKS